ncbi:MAG: virulence regulator, partial [Neisseria sp.]
KFPVELHDREDKKIEEAVLLMINPPRKAPSLSR